MMTTCTACHTPVNRAAAVIRSRSFTQVAYHPHCFTVVRALAGVTVSDASAPVGGTLGERMERARAAARLTAHMRG